MRNKNHPKPWRLTDEERWFIQGQWESFDRVLAYLNTLETRTVDKHTVYGAIMSMRPIKKERQINCPKS